MDNSSKWYDIDLTIPEEFQNAIAENDSKIDAQLATWKIYVSNLDSSSRSLTTLSNIMSAMREPINSELRMHSAALKLQK